MPPALDLLYWTETDNLVGGRLCRYVVIDSYEYLDLIPNSKQVNVRSLGAVFGR
jgi:hypothetical protein